MSKNSKHYKGSISSFKILTRSTDFAFLVSAMLLDIAGKELRIARIAGVKQLAELSQLLNLIFVYTATPISLW